MERERKKAERDASCIISKHLKVINNVKLKPE
jgi:hypothetical protein